MRAQITTWHNLDKWGFATTPEGKIFFVHQSAFRDYRQVMSAHYGSTIEFDLSSAQVAEQSFRDKLNSGKYRDSPSFARGHRNPRLADRSGKKPRAANVVLVEGGRTDG